MRVTQCFRLRWEKRAKLRLLESLFSGYGLRGHCRVELDRVDTAVVVPRVEVMLPREGGR